MMRLLSVLKNVALLFIVGVAYAGAAWGADHIKIRNIMIESQLAQVETSAVLVVGDSIVESWLVSSAGVCQVINGGLGGGGVSDAITLLSRLKEKKFDSKLNGIIIAVGVNDADEHKEKPITFMEEWQENYKGLIELALQLHPIVSVSTILPIEEDMPLGRHFDPTLIDSLNTAIREIAKKQSVRLIDLNNEFSLKTEKRKFTIDGIHLSVDAYKIFANGLLTGIPKECAATAFGKK